MSHPAGCLSSDPECGRMLRGASGVWVDGVNNKQTTRCLRDRLAPKAALIALLAHAAPTQAATVEAFSPQGTVKDIRQVAARFSEPMVAFGDPRLPTPFDVDCAAPGRGRWADTRNWVYDFESELPAGLACRFTLRDGLKSVGGASVTGRRQYTFDTGGPSIRASLPADGDANIDADQVFVLALDASATPDTVAQHAACAVENVGERIPVDVLAGRDREQLLAQRRRLGYQYLQLFGELRTASGDPDARADIARLESALTVLRCRRSLPPDTKVSLVWRRGIATAGGRATRTDQILDFRTRPDFTARLECERVNPNAPCLPMRPLRLRFSAPVPSELARGITLTDASGRAYASATSDGASSRTIESMRFDGPFPERGELTLVLGAGLRDDAGRPLGNADRFPLKVPLDDYPPLVKFPASFGILESAGKGVLPVTVRHVEPRVAGRRTSFTAAGDLPGQTLRVVHDHEIAAWLERLAAATAARGEWQERKGDEPPAWRELTGSSSVFRAGDELERFRAARSGRRTRLRGGRHPSTRSGLPCRRDREPSSWPCAARRRSPAVRGERRARHQHGGSFQVGARILPRLGDRARYRPAREGGARADQWLLQRSDAVGRGHRLRRDRCRRRLVRRAAWQRRLQRVVARTLDGQRPAGRRHEPCAVELAGRHRAIGLQPAVRLAR